MAAITNSRLRTLHLVKTSVGATWALRQMRELVKLGVEVHVALPNDGPLIPYYKKAGITVHPYQFDIPIKHLWSARNQFEQLRQLVEIVRPDIIHSHFVGTTLTMRLALGKNHQTPRVFQVPGPLHLEHPFFRRAEIITAGKSDYWIGSCKWTCDQYKRSGIASDRVFLSYYGIDLSDFETQQNGKLRQELALPAHTPLVGMVAYMYAPKRYLGQKRGLKGHETLIDALATCRKRDPRITGVFIGGAWNNAHWYESKVRDYGQERCGKNAIFLGTRHDVPELYPDLDVAVHPSLSENVGGAVESLLAGIPTITTNVGGFPDIIIHGETGWLVPPQNPDLLADLILEVLADPVRSYKIALNGQALVRKLFDVRNTAATIKDIYQKILSRQRIIAS